MNSPVDVMNSALRKVGAEAISSENDNNNRARLVKAAFYDQRDYYQRAHPWKFNISYIALAAVSPKPDDVFDYDYVFQLPDNCLRVLDVSCGQDKWTEIEGKRIATDESSLKVKFIKLVADVSKWDSNFCEVLATATALDIAYPLTQSASMVQTLEGKLKNLLAESRSYSAQIGAQKQVGARGWLDSRR